MKTILICILSFMSMKHSFGLTITPYSEKVLNSSSEKSYVLHFFAEWCSICQHQKKLLAELKKDKDLKGLIIYVVDFDLEKAMKEKYEIERQSTFVAIKSDVEVGRSLGVREKENLAKLFKKTLLGVQDDRPNLNKLKSELNPQ